MPRGIRCFKKHSAIDLRRDPYGRPSHIVRPELQVSLPVFLPLRVEIQKEIQSAQHTRLRVHIKIGVDVKKPARMDFVQSRTDQTRVGSEVIDSSDGCQKLNEFRGLRHREEIAL